MRYVFLRLFLTEVEQPPILVETGDIPARRPRQDHLRFAFSGRHDFVHRGTDMVFVPVDLTPNDDEKVVFGRVGRPVTNTIHEGPERQFEASTRDSWRAANVAIHTGEDADGQILVMQERGDVGKPLAISASLVASINEMYKDHGWFISVNAMIEKSSFWEAVEKYKGQITKAEFTYVTPNVLGIRSKLNERLREYRERENAQEVSVSVSEPNGNLQLDSEEVRDSVDYISEGGGSARLKAGRETVYDSQDTQKSKDVEADDNLLIDSPEGRNQLSSQFFK